MSEAIKPFLLKRKLFLEKKSLRKLSQLGGLETVGWKSELEYHLTMGALEEINKILYKFFPKEKK